MKNKIYKIQKLFIMFKYNFLITVCALVLSSCTSEHITKSALYIKSISPKVSIRSSNAEEGIKFDTLVWCTGDDIKWYNSTTGELKLKNIPELPYAAFHRLDIFLDDLKLFSLEVANGISSTATAFPCITTEFKGEAIYSDCKCGIKEDHLISPNCGYTVRYTEGVRYYISKGYPRWDPILDSRENTPLWNWEEIDGLREENWKAIETEWNIFIEQLKKEGKYRE